MRLYVEFWRKVTDLLHVAGRINLLKKYLFSKVNTINGIGNQLQIIRKSQYLDHGGFAIPTILAQSSDDCRKSFWEFEGNL